MEVTLFLLLISISEYLQYRSLTVSTGSASLSQVPQLDWDFEQWFGEPDYRSLVGFGSDEFLY